MKFTLLLAKVNTVCDYGLLELSTSLSKQIVLEEEHKTKDNSIFPSNTQAFQLLLAKLVKIKKTADT